MPRAPAATLPTRIAQQIATMLAAHQTPTTIIDEELRHTRECRVAATVNRGVVGTMTEFTHLAEAHRTNDPHQDLPHLALRLATTLGALALGAGARSRPTASAMRAPTNRMTAPGQGAAPHLPGAAPAQPWPLPSPR